MLTSIVLFVSKVKSVGFSFSFKKSWLMSLGGFFQPEKTMCITCG